MGKIERFEDLPVWQSAAKFGIEVYKLTDSGKLKTDFKMKDQFRGAAMSVSNNIAEGFEYGNNKKFVQFLFYAKGSAGEVRNQLYVLRGAEIVSEKIYEEMYNKCIDLSKQISGFIKYLKDFEKRKER